MIQRPKQKHRGQTRITDNKKLLQIAQNLKQFSATNPDVRRPKTVLVCVMLLSGDEKTLYDALRNVQPSKELLRRMSTCMTKVCSRV